MIDNVSLSVDKNYQMAFKAKKPNRKAIHEFIDKTNDLAFEILNKDRPAAEKRKITIRKSLSALRMKCPYAGVIVKRSEAVVEHIKSALGLGKSKEQYRQYIEKAVRDGVMDSDHAGTLLIKADSKIKK